jgi:SAM-dependent methyltransferase
VAKEYWKETFPSLSADDEEFWRAQTGIKDEKQLERLFYDIRHEAWQVVQEFSIARWWFLRNIMAANPYYQEVRDLARNGSTIVDLGCGFGQDLRRLRADGATGELYGVDSRPQLWDLGSKLLGDDGSNYHFRDIDIRTGVGVDFDYDNPHGQNPDRNNPLVEFLGKADVYLLNDVFSFWGGKQLDAARKSIHKASKVGTIVSGWQIGQEGEPTEGGGRELGDGGRGVIPTLETFKQSFTYTQNVDSTIKWDVKAQLVDFDTMGFDKEDQRWFSSDFWTTFTDCERPNELKAICFLATRIQ